MELNELSNLFGCILPKKYLILDRASQDRLYIVKRNGTTYTGCYFENQSKNLLCVFHQYCDTDEELLKYLRAIGDLDFKYVDSFFRKVFTFRIDDEKY